MSILSSSMTHPEEESDAGKGWTEKFAGKWQDDRTAEEIIEDIRAARTTNTFDVEHIEGISIEDWA